MAVFNIAYNTKIGRGDSPTYRLLKAVLMAYFYIILRVDCIICFNYVCFKELQKN